MALTAKEVAALAIKAGFPSNVVPTMVAIAKAESGYNEKAKNSIGACGLWQIHPYQAGCLDAFGNAMMAIAKYRSQGLRAWSTYTNGSYKKYLAEGTRAYAAAKDNATAIVANLAGKTNVALNEATANAATGGLSDTLSALDKALSFPDRVTNWLANRDNIFRIVKVVAGGGLVLLGLGIVASSAAYKYSPVGKLTGQLQKAVKRMGTT